jgi:addiction module HigA family antidote
MTRKRLLEPIHPGEILLEEFMKPMDININRLAREIHVSPGRISAIVNGKRAITADGASAQSVFGNVVGSLDRTPGGV